MKKEVFEILGGQVTSYLHADSSDHLNSLFPALILCPGGAYQKYGVCEGLPVVRAAFRAGFSVFLLSYAIGEFARNLLPLRQLSKTVATVRRNHQKFGIDPHKIAVMGFSAGGHLAATLGTLWNHPILSQDGKENRPDILCLSYPIISLLQHPHLATNQAILAGKGGMEYAELLSAERRVSSDTPPTFLWHTMDDSTVSVEHSIIFAQSLEREKVPFQLKLFPHGVHGCGLCQPGTVFENPEVEGWFFDWLDFFHRQTDFSQ